MVGVKAKGNGKVENGRKWRPGVSRIQENYKRLIERKTKNKGKLNAYAELQVVKIRKKKHRGKKWTNTMTI